MLYGGHIKSINDVGDLKHLGFDFGEVILENREARTRWLDSGLVNESDSCWFMIAHGPREGPPNDVRNLWDCYFTDLKETVDVSKELGIRFLTVHLWLDPRFVKPDVVVEKVDFLREIVGYGQKRNVLISLENLSENAADLNQVLIEVPGLSVTLDMGHGQLLTEQNTSFGIIDRLMTSIGHVHLHDNYGGTGVADDRHLPIGDGIIDFAGILETLITRGYNGTITLELEKEDLKSSWVRLRKLIDSIRSRLSPTGQGCG
ncbi:MAG: sugar phosphate isomerase/epimerase family protein [Desulfomonile sp.]|jgi:sugar phosphate isomerase/epimerase|nr:sugar phosphate isomerase/epimerase [Deltaproteobacteria bacterium]